MPRFIAGTKNDFAPDDIVVSQCLSPACAAGCADHLSVLAKLGEPTRLHGFPLKNIPCRDASAVLFLVVDTHARARKAA